jgi:hypothetical protein
MDDDLAALTTRTVAAAFCINRHFGAPNQLKWEWLLTTSP